MPGGGFVVMPGGLAMTVDPEVSMALTAPESETRDVWVLSESEQPPYRSLWRPAIDAPQILRSPRELPSRAADNLFWLGRYIERADWTFRVLRNCLGRIEEDSGPRQNLALSRALLLAQLKREDGEPIEAPTGLDEAHAVAWLARQLMISTDRSHGLPRTLGHIHRVASLTRDRLSLEAWRTLNAFYVSRRWQAASMPQGIGESLDLIDAGLAVIAAFNGLTHENMTRNLGWSFLDMGRRLSRAQNVAHLLLAAFGRRTTGEADDAAGLLSVLELADSFITYRSRYRLDPKLSLVLDLLVCDETNPRSLGFQLDLLARHIDTLPQTGQGQGRSEVQRAAISLLDAVRLADVVKLAEVDDKGRRLALEQLLSAQIKHLPQLSDAITRRYFSVVEREPRWIRAQTRQDA
jgi:uncharacterized alpha-E superfamily protein